MPKVKSTIVFKVLSVEKDDDPQLVMAFKKWWQQGITEGPRQLRFAPLVQTSNYAIAQMHFWSVPA